MPVSDPRSTWTQRFARLLRKLLVGTCLLAVSLFALTVWLIEGNVVKGNYPPALQSLGWALGEQEHIYNFGSVVPGKIFRSGEPDGRFIQYVAEKYGIRHIITLNGNSPNDDPSVRDMGITFETYDWDKDDLPTREEFQQVVHRLDTTAPVLVHCTGGKDRTGYLVAGYRVLQSGWPMEKALNEMRNYGHNPTEYPEALDFFKKAVALKISSAAN